MNSGDFGIFDPDEFYSNLYSRVKSALKTIQSDIEIAYSCVGKIVDGTSSEVLGVFSKDSLVSLEHFDANLMGAAAALLLDGEKSSDQKTVQNEFNGD